VRAALAAPTRKATVASSRIREGGVTVLEATNSASASAISHSARDPGVMMMFIAIVSQIKNQGKPYHIDLASVQATGSKIAV
jgi:hypothetical protein